MPIDYSKYPPNWKNEIVPRILKRAGNKCEFCDVENKKTVRRLKENPVKYLYWERNLINMEETQKIIGQYYNLPVKVVLTVAHLDHDPENWEIKDERLTALCQRCHLKYDRDTKIEYLVNSMQKKLEKVL